MNRTENYQIVIDRIREDHPADEFLAELDETIIGYCDYEQMEDEGIEDEFEWYSNFGSGEAESDVIEQNYIVKTSKEMGIQLTTDEHCEMFDELNEFYLG